MASVCSFSSMADPIRVLVVDDQYLVREGIASLLELDASMTVVGMASDGKDAIEKAKALNPNITLMDVRMPVMNGVEATARLREAVPNCQVIILTTFDDEEFVLQSILAGACGYLMKDLPPKDLVQAIQLAHAGIYQLAPGVAGKLVGAIRSQPTISQPLPLDDVPLTAREIEVLKLIALGQTNKQIAKTLNISDGTVRQIN